MVYPVSRRTVLGTVAFATTTAGCLDGNSDGNGNGNTTPDTGPEEDASNNESIDGSEEDASNSKYINDDDGEPDRITWHARVYSELPDEDKTVYQPDHDLLKEFSPLEYFLDQANKENIYDGYTLAAPTMDYDTEEAKDTQDIWEKIEDDANGSVFVEYEEWYLRLIYAPETDE
ncbi:hypothetical protein ACLI4Z_17810 [Natrialbaceae archaeon A-arb3/5]